MSVFIGYPSFMAYQMMKGKKGNNDGFPSIPGMIARYSALGLTNEQMAANPVWVDKTGNGHDLQMKNFFWGGMSGVGGYSQNFNQYFIGVDESNRIVSDSSMKLVLLESDSQKVIYDRNSHQIGHTYNFYIKVTGIEGRMLNVNAGTSGGRIMSITEDGIYSINVTVSDSWRQNRLYLVFPPSSSSNTVTLEQLPLYPGALIFDGVDDYGTCKNFPILTKEKGYTVVVLRQWDQDFLNTTLTGGLLSTRNYSTGEGVAFEKIESSNKGYWNLGAGGIIDFAKSPFTWQTSKQYNNVGILKGDKNHGKPLCVGCGLSGGQQCGRFAIWELVFLDHDATEEELTKIKDYFVKTYPWLFPDQAWTVVGKTNEDEDRATIANITGNGNDLVLSNFGFAEGSGYGLYKQNFSKIQWTGPSSRVEVTKTNSSFNITEVKGITIQLYYLSNINEVAFTVPSTKVRVVGLTDGQSVNYRYFVDGVVNHFLISSDGIYDLPAFEFPAKGDYYGFEFTKIQSSCNITIEQIPEYEGYLVTDGVDDRVESSPFTLNEDWTIVGNWTMLSNIPSSCGIIKVSSTFLYNSLDGVTIYFKGGPIEIQSKSINAFCSDGRIYLNDWTEILKPDVRIASGGSKSGLKIASYSAYFTKMAFKNLAIYDGKNLSKDDCIKAYNYLQTIKSK